MTGRVAIVTDSTAHLAPDVAAKLGIDVVPLQVIVNGEPMDEGTGVGPREVAEALRARVPVTTSRPSPRAFLEVYESAASKGAASVVSIHLSGSLSGTADSARLAARDAAIPVHVVDSRSLGMGLGFAVLAAAQAADHDRTPDEVATTARDRAIRSSAFFYVDTLDYLRRGGRVGTASAMVGTALAIKPLLHLRDGWIEPLEKVRTSSRALARLEDLAVQRVISGPAAASVSASVGDSSAVGHRVDVAVHHLDNAERAEKLAAHLRRRLPSIGELLVSEVGAVIGAHVGPGLLAVIVSPR
jgi:DegV family protein with EDD domain